MDEDTKVEKPQRNPDTVIKPGHAVWWAEMIHMHVFGAVSKMYIDQEDASLYIVHDGKKQKLSQEIKDLYDGWWYESFEVNVLGESNE